MFIINASKNNNSMLMKTMMIGINSGMPKFQKACQEFKGMPNCIKITLITHLEVRYFDTN